MEALNVLSLIVKGNRYQAARVSADHGVPFIFLYELGTQTVGLTHGSNENAVASWFAEEGPFVPGFGYANGTLLVYSHHDGVTCCTDLSDGCNVVRMLAHGILVLA